MQAPATIGPYRVLGTLGRGGMGVVYRATRSDGVEVALKTVKRAHERAVDGIRREIEALARVRHPGVVRILEHGVSDGLPWCAMELVRGPSLRTTVDRVASRTGSAPSGDSAHTWSLGHVDATDELPPEWTEEGEIPPSERLPAAGGELSKVLSILRRLCSALAFLHGEGVVHRDLKPENVILVDGRTPVLVDFGLVAPLAADGRETLSIDGRLVGTAAYAAPEVIRGELVDARADLYSLGCVLYELVAGRPPFSSRSVSTLLRKHLDQAPTPLSRMVDGIPPALEELVQRLLAKDPAERIGYAADVDLALAALGAERDPAGPEPRPYLYRPRLAGRDDVLDEIRAHLGSTGRGVLVVLGESGAGKTRVVLEAAREVASRRTAVLVGECGAHSAEGATARGGPLHPFARALQAIVDRTRSEGVGPPPAWAAELAPYHPDVAALAGEESPRRPDIAHDASRRRLFTSLSSAFREYAPGRPTVLVLDDLQWADELTLEWLEWLARTPGSDPLRVVAMCRADHRAAAVDTLLGAPNVWTLSVEPLGRAAVCRVVRDMLALRHDPEGLVTFLEQASGGNPMFVAEYLQTAVRGGILWRDREGDWQVGPESDERAAAELFHSLPVPGSLRELLARRLDVLNPRVAELVELASVVGMEIPRALLGSAPGALDDALTSQVLDAMGGDRVRFHHAQLREVAYARIAPERKVELHRWVADRLEHDARADDHAALAHHWELGGDRSRARVHALLGARHLAERHALGEAERLYLLGIGWTPSPSAESVVVHNELGALYQLRGRYSDALRAHERAREDALAVSDASGAASGWRGVAACHAVGGRVDEARTACEEALRLLEGTSDRAAVGETLSELAHVWFRAGEHRRGREVVERALVIHREVGDRRAEGRAVSALANLLAELGELDEAVPLYHSALAVQQLAGDRTGEGRTLGNLAEITFMGGDLEGAMRMFRAALAIYREVGDRRFEGWMLADLAQAEREAGRPAESRALLAEAIAIHREVGNRAYEAVAIADRAELDADEGRADDAVAGLEEAAQMLAKVGNTWYRAEVLVRLASVVRSLQGDLARAEGLLDEAGAVMGDAQAIPGVLWSCERGQVAAARGEDASPWLARASEIAERCRVSGGGLGARALRGLRQVVDGRARVAQPGQA